MSEAQERYEYDPDYDEEPTEDAWTIRQDVFSRRYFVETADEIGTRVIADCSDEDRARLIAAAGTAAQEAKEMGYDPQKAVEALPDLLVHLEGLILCLNEAHLNAHPEGHMQGRRYGPSVDKAKNTLNALASAEGSENEQ
jgi:hypothetical protein